MWEYKWGSIDAWHPTEVIAILENESFLGGWEPVGFKYGDESVLFRRKCSRLRWCASRALNYASWIVAKTLQD
jgi:hypothetical protein